MLEELLKSVADGGIHSLRDLAGQLGVSPEMVEAMLDDLTRRGYLRVLGNGCDGQCATCPLGGCAVAGSNRLWSLTEKGIHFGSKTAGGGSGSPRHGG